MFISDYIELNNLKNKNEVERAILLCYYHFKETGETTFSIVLISELMEQSGFNKPNSSRLRNNLIKGKNKAFINSKTEKNKLEFIPAVLQNLDKKFCTIWNDSVTINSNSELIEEAKFCGKRHFIDRLIKQINFTYGNNCYDACAVLMRRLFEILLILSYQYNGIEAEITNLQGNYLMLEGIIKNAIKSKKLAIPSRITRNYDSFREIGNNSAHSITYTAGKKDIDDIKSNYRVMMEDLYNRANLI